MLPTAPLPLNHSWPLYESGCRFDHGRLHDMQESGAIDRLAGGAWSVDLADQSLRWDTAVYDLFGIGPDQHLLRAQTVALYAEDSRSAMERLRAYAIRHRRGFTLDARIITIQGRPRYMRLIAAPACDGDRVVGLYGVKQDVTAEYRV